MYFRTGCFIRIAMRKRRRNTFPYKDILLLTALLVLFIAALRGCMTKTEEPDPGEPPTIRVYLHKEDRVAVMSAEDYLLGVLGGEMPASFPLEALKAQAVAARTYTLRRMAQFGYEGCGEDYDICTDSGCCQAYKSPDALMETFGENAHAYMDKLRSAVRSTAGLVAVYDGEPIEALYHSSAGGHTEDAQNVFSARLPYLVGVESPGEEDSAKYKDSKSYSPKEFAAAVNKKYPKAGLKANKLSSQTEILCRYQSGQVEKISLGKVTVSGKEFRKLFSLNSANFQIEFREDEVIITTLGFGHGVGMSQYGARAMALDGAEFEEILGHYYTGVEVERVW